jgi:predicted nuclease with TOPRIM domain
MVPEAIDMDLVRQGITRAALDHNTEIARLQAELHAAYKEIEASSAVADMKRLREQLHETRAELEQNRKKLGETERKLAALSRSRLGAFQLRYWRWRNGKRNA